MQRVENTNYVETNRKTGLPSIKILQFPDFKKSIKKVHFMFKIISIKINLRKTFGQYQSFQAFYYV